MIVDRVFESRVWSVHVTVARPTLEKVADVPGLAVTSVMRNGAGSVTVSVIQMLVIQMRVVVHGE